MTLLVQLSTLKSTQSHGIEETARAKVKLLNYCIMHPYAAIRYKQSDMVFLQSTAMPHTCSRQNHSVNQVRTSS